MKKLLILTITIFMLFQMTVYAAYPFDDVNEDDWYSEAVNYVYSNGLMTGTGSNQFTPDANMSRAMLVTVLYSMEGKPSVFAVNPFADVASSDYYYYPVVWAYENGIVAGTSATTFEPDNNITREQMVAIFAKYAAYKGLKVSATANIDRYSDKLDVSAYAVDAFMWAVNAGIVSGTSKTTLSPQGTATRAQCAVIMRQFERWSEEQKTDIELPDIEDGAGWA